MDRVVFDGPTVRYTARPLLGFTSNERQKVLDHLIDYLNGKRDGYDGYGIR